MLSNIVKKNYATTRVISETKTDDFFPSAAFYIPGFSTPYRVDKSANKGGLMFYIRSDSFSNILSFAPLPETVQGIFIEINLFKVKWLIVDFSNPNKYYIAPFLNGVSKYVDVYLNKYDNLKILGEFNSESVDVYLNEYDNLIILGEFNSECRKINA